MGCKLPLNLRQKKYYYDNMVIINRSDVQRFTMISGKKNYWKFKDNEFMAWFGMA